MIGADTMQADPLTMLLCGVAHVMFPVIVGIPTSQVAHIIITESLGENTCSSYGLVFSVTFDDGGVWKGTVGHETITVDDDCLRAYIEGIEGTVHGKKTGLENIDTIYLFGSNDTHSPRHGIVHDLLSQFVAPFVRKLFAVVKRGIIVIARQNDSRCIDTSGQTATSGFIASGLYKVGIKMWLKHIDFVNES